MSLSTLTSCEHGGEREMMSREGRTAKVGLTGDPVKILLVLQCFLAISSISSPPDICNFLDAPAPGNGVSSKPFIQTGQGIVYRRDVNRHERAMMMASAMRTMKRYKWSS